MQHDFVVNRPKEIIANAYRFNGSGPRLNLDKFEVQLTQYLGDVRKANTESAKSCMHVYSRPQNIKTESGMHACRDVIFENLWKVYEESYRVLILRCLLILCAHL